MRNQKLRQQIINAECAIFIAILAQFTLPLGIVPLTGQTLAIGIVATLLSPVDTTIAIALYLLMGAIGLPVFAGFKGGIGVIFGPTGGYLVGFLLTGWLISLLVQKFSYQFLGSLLANLIGAIFTLAIGFSWLKLLAKLSWQQAFLSGFVAFLFPAVIKALFATLIGLTIYRVLKHKFKQLSP